MNDSEFLRKLADDFGVAAAWGEHAATCKRLREIAERAEESRVLLRLAREALNVWNTDSEAVNRNCPCSACHNTRTQRRIDAFLEGEQ